MPIDPTQLRTLVVKPVLLSLGLPSSEVAENLIMGTAAHESHLGDYIEQVGGGPALGIFQMEPATLNDCYENYLDYRADLKAKVDGFLAAQPATPDGSPDKQQQLATNLAYATAMCRIRYYRRPPRCHQIPMTSMRWGPIGSNITTPHKVLVRLNNSSRTITAILDRDVSDRRCLAFWAGFGKYFS